MCSSEWQDFCPANGSKQTGCTPYNLLPPEVDWLQLRKRLVKEMFGEDYLPMDNRPHSVTHTVVPHRFPDCLAALPRWGTSPATVCEKLIPVTEIVWQMTARLNATYAKNITSKVFLTLNSSGWAPGYSIWGADEPEAPEPPHRGKTLVIFHHGHGGSKGCPNYGDTDGTGDWLNQLGMDVATMMMPFFDCNTMVHQPGSLHAWFKLFEDQRIPWVRFFLEPVIKTINFAKERLGYERVILAGLSGGGWTTTLVAALDPRIELSIPMAGSIPCDFRPTSKDFEQFCNLHWTGIGNYTALYVLAALEPHRTSLQLLHEADPCCFHGCGRHRRIQEYGDFVRARSAGHFRTVVTEGNLHLVNPREKIIIGTLLYKMARGQAVTAADLLTPFDLLREVDAIYS